MSDPAMRRVVELSKLLDKKEEQIKRLTAVLDDTRPRSKVNIGPRQQKTVQDSNNNSKTVDQLVAKDKGHAKSASVPLIFGRGAAAADGVRHDFELDGGSARKVVQSVEPEGVEAVTATRLAGDKADKTDPTILELKLQLNNLCDSITNLQKVIEAKSISMDKHTQMKSTSVTVRLLVAHRYCRRYLSSSPPMHSP